MNEKNKGFKYLKILIFFGVFLGLFSCSLNKKTNTWDFRELPSEGETLVVFDLSLEAGHLMGPENDCELIFEDEKGGEQATTVKKGDRRYFVEFPDGTWKMDRLKCGLVSRFPIEAGALAFHLRGKATFLGVYSFVLPNASELEWESVRLSREEKKARYLSLPEVVRKNYIHPVSGRPVRAEELDLTLDQPSLNFFDFELETQNVLAEQIKKQIQLCLGIERQRNPFWIGRLGIKAEAEKEPKTFWNKAHYGKEFLTCLKPLVSYLKQEVRSGIVEVEL